ncbi:hypothetical protein [Kribbella solani]|uniref:hypothetical protein n=1 Tax=Kribbella solani TaxID=236067 RepID=UPI0029AA145F|nr:hypothetical protein [Kribbella solani]MDX2970975.1 hypothetical protein [Kribbella solani]
MTPTVTALAGDTSNAIALAGVVVSFVMAAAALGVSLIHGSRTAEAASRSADEATRAADAAQEQADAVKLANKIAAEANQLVRDIQAEQNHQQAKPEVKLTIGEPPSQGWIPVELWCPVNYDSATITVPRAYLTKHLFAGLGPGSADPHRQEFSPSFDLPAGEAGATVTCGLWVYHAEEISEHTVRLLCEVRSNGKPWNYTFEHTFPHSYDPTKSVY